MSVASNLIAREACKSMRQKVWDTHWLKGHTVLTASQVIEYIREIRTSAHCVEQQLPGGLLFLLEEAREARDKREDVKLSKLLHALNQVVLPAT